MLYNLMLKELDLKEFLKELNFMIESELKLLNKSFQQGLNMLTESKLRLLRMSSLERLNT